MSIISKKGRKGKSLTRRSGFMLAILLTLSMGLVGSAMALWSDSLTIEQSSQTGTFFPKFTDEYSISIVIPGAFYGQWVSADITDKKTTVAFTNAVNGDGFTYNFKIKNNGTVPLKIGDYPLPAGVDPTKVSITISDNDLNPGDETSGTLTVTKGEGVPNTFSVEFPCCQWNLSSSNPAAWKDTLTLECNISGPVL